MDANIIVLLPFLWVAAALVMQRVGAPGRPLKWAYGAFTVALLLLLWITAFTFEQWWTDAHLAGYYCCAMDGDLPPIGSGARAFSDFFAALPGNLLPSFLFVAGSVALTVRQLRRAQEPLHVLSVIVFLTLFYVLLELAISPIGWSISSAVNGPERSVYSGLDRTIYGIVLHFLLWLAYFWALARADRIAARQASLRLRVTE